MNNEELFKWFNQWYIKLAIALVIATIIKFITTMTDKALLNSIKNL